MRTECTGIRDTFVQHQLKREYSVDFNVNWKNNAEKMASGNNHGMLKKGGEKVTKKTNQQRHGKRNTMQNLQRTSRQS